jgi:hypothetical protein
MIAAPHFTHDRHKPPVDLAVPRDHAVSRRLDTVHRTLREVRLSVDPQFDKGAIVDQQREPLLRFQLPSGVLLGDLLLAATERYLGTPGVEIVNQRAQQRRSWSRWTCPGEIAFERTSSASFPDRVAFLEERRDAFLNVLCGERKRELRAQEVKGIGEGHVLLAEDRVFAEAHHQR